MLAGAATGVTLRAAPACTALGGTAVWGRWGPGKAESCIQRLTPLLRNIPKPLSTVLGFRHLDR